MVDAVCKLYEWLLVTAIDCLTDKKSISDEQAEELQGLLSDLLVAFIKEAR